MNISKKEIFLAMLVAVLGGLYVCYFTDWFRQRVIKIEHTARPLREAWTGGGQRVDPTGKQLNNVSFSLHQNYRLTSVRVFRLAETSNEAPPLWHLVSKAGSSPVNTVAYGMAVPGMTSSIPGMVAGLLEPGFEYRLVVEARSAQGTNDFSIPARSAAVR